MPPNDMFKPLGKQKIHISAIFGGLNFLQSCDFSITFLVKMMNTVTSPQHGTSSSLPRIYSLYTPSTTISAQVPPSPHNTALSTPPSLEAITYKLQDIRLRLLTSTDLHSTKVDLTLMILELCKSLEQAISHVQDLKTTRQAQILQKFKLEGPMLSRRQLQVLNFASQGLSNKDIAERLDLSLPTVTHHLSQAYKTLGVRSRGKAIAICREKQII